MIDLRSDTVTRPTPSMRKAMNAAELGDDVFDDDPTVDRLEALVAETLGKEASMFVPSGTQSNLAALMTHCARGDEYLVGQQAHTYLFEGGGGATLAGLQPQPLDQEPDGTLDLGKLAKLIKPDDYHYARTRLLCLENTTWGKALPQEYLAEAKTFADEHGLALHLDGARIFNAAVEQGTTAAEIAAPFDSVSVCLSKGLGCPVGSVLAGPSDFVKQARRWRKMLGGGMRQSGILAAAGIHALQHHVDRLAEDHANARLLAKGLDGIDGIEVATVQTNMVFATIAEHKITGLAEHLRKNDILNTAPIAGSLRLVTHLDVDADAIRTAVETFAEYFA
ncbi:MAG: low-specificity L-threonine aldolase [Opitutae bacterium]|nr:low-specificity L-threonine aldolase [Opitutae bacterium]MBT6851898.1 low-specificity L-threonine aldolase [Opitutae bacterium]MBT7741127.1 low-specificity L-threonine aldolase [Opitutae bacterium]MBT7923435.1 low-specificity L-threonine aldolase [Opitutae bacterium]